MNRCPKEIPHRSKKSHSKNRSKLQQTHNLLTDDVGNIISRNKERDLVLVNKPRTFS